MDSRLQRRVKWWKEQLRKKNKHKRDTVVAEKLDDDSVDESKEVTRVTPTKTHDRKRKRKKEMSETVSEDASFIQVKKKKKKDNSFNDAEAVEDVPEDPSSDSTVKKKYILFVGNVPFSATADDITNHFQRAGIKVINFRLLTKKSGSSKGCGFMELKSSKQMQAGLKLHHTKFDDRRINVELSCGGGGKNEKRKDKIKAKNRKLQKQRIKKRKLASKTKSTDETVTSE